MTNFKIEFLISPWLLFLLIPALALTLFPYFRMAKRYRKTRNRIVSIVLHLIIMVLCISVLSGMKFSYDVPNAENELVILVDSSYSFQDKEKRADTETFILNVIEENDGKSRIAVVKFGYDQQTVLDTGNYNADTVLDRLNFEDDPDTTATDIRAALEYVWNPTTKSSTAGLIHYPQTAKILLISDGLQTDQDALTLARSINADGIRIDTANPSMVLTNDMDEVRIVDVTFPDQNLALSENFDMEITLQGNFQDSSKKHSIVLSATDDDGSETKDIPAQTIDNVNKGLQTIRISYAFNTPGHHELRFTLTAEDDTVKENNTYYVYYDLIEFNKVLIIERYENESDNLNAILNEEVNADNYYEVTVVSYSDTDNIPETINEMRAYDQIILCNISHEDMGQMNPAFEENINAYAYTYGGGVLTVGGQERDDNGQIVMEPVDGMDGVEVPKAHSYNREDMVDTTYQRMLPVEVIDYTPPIAVVIILDQSGSMSDGGTAAGDPLAIAGSGAIACVDALNQRDWVGVMGLKDSYTTALDMTPCTQKNRIISAIRQASEHAEGGTNYYPALDRACLALSSMTSVERRHIILISDGGHFDHFEGDEGGWKPLFERGSNADISVSVVTIGDNEPSDDINQLCDFTGGRSYQVPFSKIEDLPQMMLEEISLPEITGVNVSEEYSPKINTRTSITGSEITQEMLDQITMTGFFGTRAKSTGDVSVPLNAKFVPLYAQWTYGKGMVGSFMCDLNGVWSQEFLDSQDAGVPIINNIVSALMPTSNVRAQTLQASLSEDNYRTQISVTSEVGEDERLFAFVQAPPEEGSFDAPPPVKYDFGEIQDAERNVHPNVRLTIENKIPGIYKITVFKASKDFSFASNDNINTMDDISDYGALFESYRVLSYSEEYNVFRDAGTEGAALLEKVADFAEGTFLNHPDANRVGFDDPSSNVGLIFAEFLDLHKEWDPRLAFIIISLILFLLDVTVRKFKWKWPHEIVRDRKAKQAMARN